MDNEFIQNYNSIRVKENINVDFIELQDQSKIDLLIKNFFFVICNYNCSLNLKKKVYLMTTLT